MSQQSSLRDHLQAGRPITPREALLLYGVLRLSARIYNLRAEGLDIQRRVGKDSRTGNRVAEYYVSGVTPVAVTAPSPKERKARKPPSPEQIAIRDALRAELNR